MNPTPQKRKKLVYVAHKIRDPRGPYWMVQHIRQAERVALDLWRLGAAVICPGLNTYLLDGALPDDTWLEGDFEIIRRCDALVMSPNWVNSPGAHKERELATSLGLPVFLWSKPEDRTAFAQWVKEVEK